MDLCYTLLKCADMSHKGFGEIEKLQKIPDKFNLEDYIRENDVGNSCDEPKSDTDRERISKYNEIKEKILTQILPFCAYLNYYEQESNNSQVKQYAACFIEATDIALSEHLDKLEKVLMQNNCNYNKTLAVALAIRYGIDKGILKIEE